MDNMAKVIQSITGILFSSFENLFYFEDKDDVATSIAKMLSSKN